MSGNFLGGKHAAETNKRKFGKDFYRRIGAMGGVKGHTGGFAANPELARLAGKVGGSRSSRASKMPKKERDLKQKVYYYKSRLAHFENKMAHTDDKLVIKDCKEAKAHYKVLFKEAKAELKEYQKA